MKEAPIKKSKKQKYIGRDRVISEETGEIVNQVAIYREYNDKEEFVRIFTSDLRALYDLPKVGFYVMVYIMEECAFNKNLVSLHKYNKEEIAEKFGVEMQSINNAITKLVKRKIIVRKAPGLYFVNGHLIYKGEWEKRERVIKLVIEYVEKENKEE